MANDLRLNLRLNAEDFDKNLSKSKKQIDSWRKKTQVVSSEMAKGFGVLAGAVLGAQGAAELFNKTINSTQATGDAYQKMMDQMTSSSNLFFASIAQADFSLFINGLRTAIQESGKLSTLMDNLGTNKLFSSPQLAKIDFQIAEQNKVVKDKSKSQEERKEAAERIKQLQAQKKNIKQLTVDQQLAVGYQSFRSEIADVGYNRGGQLSDYAIDKLMDNLRTGKAGDIGAKWKELYNKAQDRTEVTSTGATVIKSASDEDRKAYADFMATNKGQWAQANYYANQMQDAENSKVYKGIQELSAGYSAMAQMINEETSALVQENRITGSGGKSSFPNANDQSQKLVNYTRDQLEEAQRFAGLGRLKKQGASMLEEAKAIKEKVNTEFNQIGAGIEIPDELNRWQQERIDLLNQQREAQEALNDSMYVGSEIEGMLFGSDSISKGLQVLALYDTLGTALQKLDGLKAVSAANDNAIADQKVAANEKETASAMTAFSAQLMKWFAFAGPFAPVLAMGVSMAAMAGLGQIVGMLPKFATGGIVGGGSYSGDRIPALLNAGEMVLNDRQQTALFNQLDRGNSGNGLSGQVEFIIKGDYLKGILNKTNRRDSRV